MICPALFLKCCSNVCQECITTADSKLNFNFKAVYVLSRSQLSLMSLIHSQMNCRGYLQLNRKLRLHVFVLSQPCRGWSYSNCHAFEMIRVVCLEVALCVCVCIVKQSLFVSYISNETEPQATETHTCVHPCTRY